MSSPSSYFDLLQWRTQCGFDLPTTSESTAKLYHAVIHQLASLTDDPSVGGLEASLLRLVDSEPDFLPGKFFLANMQLPMLDKDSEEYKASLGGIADLVDSKQKSGSLSDWESSNWTMLNLGLTGDWDKLNAHLDKHLLRWPRDYAGFHRAYGITLMSGDSRRMRDVCGQSAASYQTSSKFKDNPFKPFVVSRYGFGLEECGQFDKARVALNEALSLNPADPWAHHSMAHVLHSTGQYQVGLSYMLGSRDSGWFRGNHLRCHNMWHTALFYNNIGRPDLALDLYDREMFASASAEKSLLPTSDCVSLLFRLQSSGMDVGSRWQELCDTFLCEIAAMPSKGIHEFLFYDFHLAVALACAGRTAELQALEARLVANLQSFPAEHHTVRLAQHLAGGDSAGGSDGGGGLMRAASDYLAGDFAAVSARLYPMRHRVWGIGGSRAQRELFDRFLMHSAHRAGDWAMVGALLSETEACDIAWEDAGVRTVREGLMKHEAGLS